MAPMNADDAEISAAICGHLRHLRIGVLPRPGKKSAFAGEGDKFDSDIHLPESNNAGNVDEEGVPVWSHIAYLIGIIISK